MRGEDEGKYEKRFSKRVRSLDGAGVEEGLRDKNFNAQTWLDVRMFADICMVYYKSGTMPRTSTVLRDCVERVHEVAKERLSEDERFYDADSAITFLRSLGVSVSQFGSDRRAKSLMGKTLTLQDRVMEFEGVEAMRRKVKANDYTVEEFNKIVRDLDAAGKIPKNMGGGVDSGVDPTIRAQQAAEEDDKQKARMDEFVKSLNVAKSASDSEDKVQNDVQNGEDNVQGGDGT